MASPALLSLRNRSALSTAELAVAHCAVQLDWLQGALTSIDAVGMRLTRLNVYLKCGRSAFSHPRFDEVMERMMVPKNVSTVKELPNVGRCDHTWAYHLARYYSTLAHVVIFMKDSTFCNPETRLAKLTVPTATVLGDVMAWGFGCFRMPAVNGLYGRLHLRALTMGMRKRRYAGLTKTYSNWNSQGYTPNFAARVNMTEFARRAFDEWFFERLMGQTFIQVCYGGSFGFRGADARMHSRASFERLQALLARADNLEEGHFVERLWHALLRPEPVLPAEESAALARGITNGQDNGMERKGYYDVISTKPWYAGMIVGCCCK